MVAKKRCPNCQRMLRTKNFIYNRVAKEDICRTCNKKIGTNIFYSQEEKGNKYISKYSITEDEKKVLAANNGWERTNKTKAGLKTMSKVARKKKKQDKEDREKEKEKIKKNKEELLKGLCQK